MLLGIAEPVTEKRNVILNPKNGSYAAFSWSQDLFLQLFDSEILLLMLLTRFSNILSLLPYLFGLVEQKMHAMYQENFSMKNVCISETQTVVSA